MKPEKWQKVKNIFNDVIDLEPAERESYFADNPSETEILNEVRQMLGADEEELIEHSPFSKLAAAAETASAPPEKIGHYKIIREIGRGGMGVVYEAVRDDGEFSQKAAIKVIKRGMDSDDILRRFRNERQILAELQHPNIARLFDGGVTESGSPYYVMEYIEGEAIDAYCRDNDCSITRKLELFRQVCAAVSYAHSQLIVHRDLKPSNMLITREGSVKLLDFGIAKVLNSDGQDSLETATQLGMMTPAYASPEQIRGDKVTTVSDVYSLGVVLYELLTGERPYKTDGKSIAEVVELVCNSELRRPSDATRQTAGDSTAGNVKLNLQKQGHLFKGDLDNIALKALQKDSERRYVSVEQFSEDIRRHLKGQPITARPDTASYRFKKFVSRNKVPAVAAVLIFLSLCTGITVAVWQARQAQRERALAENRFADVRELANSVIFKYHDAIASLPGSTATREMLVKDATRYLDNLAKESAENPELQRELALAYVKLGDVLGKAYAANVGDTAGSGESYEKAVSLLESAAANRPKENIYKADLVRAYDSMFQLYMRTGDTRKPDILAKANSLVDELLASEPESREYKLQRGSLLLAEGDIAKTIPEKVPVFSQALVIADELFALEPDNHDFVRFGMRVNQRLASTYNWLGNDAIKKGQEDTAGTALYAQGLPYAERSFEMATRLYEHDMQNVAYQRNYAMGSTNLAEAYAKTGRREQSLAIINRSLDILNKMESSDARNKEARSDIAYVHESIGDIWDYLGETKKAIDEREKAIEIQKQIFREDPNNSEALFATGVSHRVLSELYSKAKDEKRAAMHKEAYAASTKLLLELRAKMSKS